MSVGRYTLSRSAAAGLTGPANERASEMGREGERIYEERYTPYQRLFCVTVFVFIIASPYGSGKGSRALSFAYSLTL
jgi:hypothetical protein